MTPASRISARSASSRGVALELSARMDGSPLDAAHIRPHNPVIDNGEKPKQCLDRMLTAASPHLSLLCHACACRVECRQDRIGTVAKRVGLVAVKPRVVIGCTGDADIAALTGVPIGKKPDWPVRPVAGIQPHLT